MFSTITRACRWARETVFKLQPAQASVAADRPSRDIARPHGRRPVALIASILGLALTAGLASGAVAQTATAPTGSSSLSSSTGTIGTPFTLTVNFTVQHAINPANTYVGLYGTGNAHYQLPNGVTVASATPVVNTCSLSTPIITVGSS